MHPLLEQRLSSNSLPQALLFTGPRGKVDATLGKELAKALFGPLHGPKIESGSHPDLHLYAPDPKSDLYVVEEIRQMIAETALPPFEASCKLFVLDEAEKMLPSSSQALLKILEEPPPDTIILLLTHDQTLLLPTIVSRCARFRFDVAPLEAPTLAALQEMLERALIKDYAAVLELLDAHAEELNSLELGAILSPLFTLSCEKRPFKKMASLIEEAERADRHNVKRKNLVLNFFLSL